LLLRMGLQNDPSPEHMCILKREQLTDQLSSVTNFSIICDGEKQLIFPELPGSDEMRLHVNFRYRYDKLRYYDRSIKFTLHSSIFGLFHQDGVKECSVDLWMSVQYSDKKLRNECLYQVK
jgi:hypothetical protein